MSGSSAKPPRSAATQRHWLRSCCARARIPSKGFRSCIGILGLRKRYGVERLDAACGKALALGTRSYSSVAAILKNNQESKTARERETEQPSLLHDTIRGPGYYH